jgi:hypothetical protein
MSTLDKKAISEALIEAMNREDLNTRATAKFLNINPCYISMAKNPNHFDTMGITAWTRIKEWLDTRDKISAFQIPEGEPIFVPKERQSAPAKPKSKKAPALKEVEYKDTGSNEAIIVHQEAQEKPPVKKKNAHPEGKSVNLILNQAELRKLNERVSNLEKTIEDTIPKELKIIVNKLDNYLEKSREIDTKYSLLSSLLKSKEPEKKKAKKGRGWSIVFFQRNIYQK